MFDAEALFPLALEAGVSIETFWDSTPWEVLELIKAAHRRDVTLAWHTAAFAGATFSKDGLDRLDAYLGTTEDEPPQTHEQQMAIFWALAEAAKMKDEAPS